MSYRLTACFLICAVFILGCASKGVVYKDTTSGYVRLLDGTKLAITKMVYPEYPPDLRKAGVVGVVTVQLSIKPDGIVSGSTVHESTNDALNDYAVKATSQWQFEPYAVRSGSAGAICVLVPIRFSLEAK